MVGIIGVVTILTVLALSLFVTRLATVALVLTGLSEESARFQARSAFTGTGFTTREAEKVVSHPVRRRIIMALMTLRSAGLVTVIISLILSFASATEDDTRLLRLLWLGAGAGSLGLLARSKVVSTYLERLIGWILKRWTDLATRDYISLLKLADEYNIIELEVAEDEWLANKTLADCRLQDEGVTVLGIYRKDGDYVGVPRGRTRIYPGDTLIFYGRGKALNELDNRQAGFSGDLAREQAVDMQRRHMEHQDAQERQHEQRRALESAVQESTECDEAEK